MSCSDAPCRNMEVAAECLRTWAAPRLWQVTSARQHRLSNDDRDRTVGGEGAKGSARANKQHIGVGLRPAVLQVGHQRPSNFLGQRQPNLATSFARYLNRGAFPIDINQTKLDDIARPKSHACEEK